MAESDLFVGGRERVGRAMVDGLIWTVLLLSPLLIGTVHPSTWLGMGLCSSLAFALALLVTSHPPPLHRLVVAVGALEKLLQEALFELLQRESTGKLGHKRVLADVSSAVGDGWCEWDHRFGQYWP